MPLRGFKCPSYVPTAGTQNTFEWCVNSCPHQCQPDFVLKKIAELEGGNEHVGDMLSPTALSGCVRRLILSRREDYWTEPAKLFDVTRGGLVHGFLDNCGIPGVIQERRIYKTVTTGPDSPWTISGRVDYYDPAKKRISDIKTMSDKGLYVVYNQGAKPEHIWQLNLYRWLMWGGHLDTPDGPQIFWPVDTLQLHFFLMNRVLSTGTSFVDSLVGWKKDKSDVNYGKPYKLETKREDVGRGPRGQTYWDVSFTIPPVPIYTHEKVEKYLVEQGPPRVRAFRDPNSEPAGVIGLKDEEWQCRFCEVKDKCDEIEIPFQQAQAVMKGLADSVNGLNQEEYIAPRRPGFFKRSPRVGLQGVLNPTP